MFRFVNYSFCFCFSSHSSRKYTTFSLIPLTLPHLLTHRQTKNTPPHIHLPRRVSFYCSSRFFSVTFSPYFNSVTLPFITYTPLPGFFTLRPCKSYITFSSVSSAVVSSTSDNFNCGDTFRLYIFNPLSPPERRPDASVANTNTQVSYVTL